MEVRRIVKQVVDMVKAMSNVQWTMSIPIESEGSSGTMEVLGGPTMVGVDDADESSGESPA